jgi:sugar lactone lactonase YvrE
VHHSAIFRPLLGLFVALLLAACGGGGGGGGAGNGGGGGATAKLALYAGNLGGPGMADGPRATARFAYPYGVATDSAGNIYVADTENQTVRKITPDGVVSTLAGVAGSIGSADGAGAAARFDNPTGIVTDSAGNLYVSDSDNNTIRKISPDGVVSTIAGLAGVPIGSADGTGSAARFYTPEGIATNSAGNVFVTDTGNCTIRKITPAGVVSTLAGTAGACGSVDATGAAARFKSPYGVATDSAGNVYVADTFNYTIRKITPGGVVSTLAGVAAVQGSADGTGAAASFYFPASVITDSAGNLYVSDTTTIRKITPDAVVTTIAGAAGVSGYADGTGAAARFSSPTAGIAIDSTDNLYVADTVNISIRKITPAGVVSTVAGAPDAPGYTDGIGAAASFDSPSGIATDRAGNVYVADVNNESIRAITPEGVVSTLAGAPYFTGTVMNPACQSADGIGTAARFCAPQGVAIDNAGNVYVADYKNSIVRKITPDGAVSTLAGLAASFGSADGTGSAARFFGPTGIATDSAGNVYVADTGNSTIRKITPAGMVSTFAGTAGAIGSADGTGSAARFDIPIGIATDSAGNVYVADQGNSTIRKITPNGMVSTLAGAAGVVGSADGVASSARFNYPRGIAIDSADNLYVADTSNSTIRKITPAGLVTTVVGIPGQAGFAPGALPGVLAQPRGVAISGNSLYITLYNGVAVVQGLL